MRVHPGGIRSVLPADVACTPVHLPLAGPSPAPLGRDWEGEVRSQGATTGLGLRSGRPALRPAPWDPQRPRVKRQPGIAARTGGTRAGRVATPSLQGPCPAAPAPLTRALQVVAGLHGGAPAAAPVGAAAARVSRGGRACRRPPLTPPSPARPRARREARPGRGVRLPEGRPGAGASPSREPGCGRPAVMTSEPTRRCVAARAGSVRSA